MCKYFTIDAGWSSSVARLAHNQEVGGSNPSSATKVVEWLIRSL